MEICRVKTRLVNSYVVAYADRILVIDVAAGCDEYVLGFVAHDLDRDIHDIALVVCTHDDPDHLGGVFRLARAAGAAVGIPYASRSPLRKLLHDPTGALVRTVTGVREMLRPRARDMYANPRRDREAQARPRFRHDAPDAAAGERPRGDHTLKHQMTLPGFPDWQVIHTPGHSWDSVCFHHAGTGSLISGDTLLGSGPRNRVVTPAIYSNPWHLRGSLARLERLAIRAVYPGHGSPIIGDDIMADLRRGS